MKNDNNAQDNVITIDLMKLLRLLWHHIVLILAITVASAIIGFCYANFFVAPTYSASADLLVNNSQDVSASTSVSNSDLTASTSLVDTYSVILKSHTVLEQVIDQLNLDMSYQSLSSRISVSAVNNTQVMRVTAKSNNAMEALAIVNCIVEMAPEVIIEAVEAGSVKMVDAPYTSGEPIAPSRTRYTAVTGLIGLVIVVAILVIRELLNNTFKTEEDMRTVMGLAVLGVIPLEESSQEIKQSKNKSQKRRSR